MRLPGEILGAGALNTDAPPISLNGHGLNGHGPHDGAGADVVLPPRSRTARRTRTLRAWMITLPVDLATIGAPAYWVPNHWRGLLFSAVLTVAIFAVGGLYRGRRHVSFLDEVPVLLGGFLVAAAVVAVIFSMRHDTDEYLTGFLHAVAISAGLLVAGRLVTRAMVVAARRRRWVEHEAIIIGRGPVAAELARALRRYPEYGLRFAGFVDDLGGPNAAIEPRMWLGRVDALEQIISATEPDVIIVADTPPESEAQLDDLVLGPAAQACDLWVVPRLHNFATHGGMPDHVGAIPVVRVRRPRMRGYRRLLKRAFDLFFASIALLLVSPVLAVVAIAARIEGGPGVLFRQQRVGYNGRLFNLLKFRSMKPASEEEARTQWTVANDPRIGPVGRFIRRTSLDELPQLWNVVRGDMTIVGPRPERPHFAERFSAEHPLYLNRHRVPVGLTGLAQVSGLRGDTPIADRARFDNYYIENWSLWLDIKVVLRTVLEVFRGGGR